MDRDKFFLITKRDVFEQIRANIDLLLKNNITVKINMVVMKGLNESEILDFISWTKDQPIQIRFIEFMSFSGNRWTSNKLFTLDEILATIRKNYIVNAADGKPNDTAKSFSIPGHMGSFAIIGTMTAPFCSTCNRMRLTADGKLKNCLFSDGETDLLTALRNNDEVLPLIRAAIWSKKKELGGQFDKEFDDKAISNINNRSMITIGG